MVTCYNEIVSGAPYHREKLVALSIQSLGGSCCLLWCWWELLFSPIFERNLLHVQSADCRSAVGEKTVNGTMSVSGAPYHKEKLVVQSGHEEAVAYSGVNENLVVHSCLWEKPIVQSAVGEKPFNDVIVVSPRPHDNPGTESEWMTTSKRWKTICYLTRQ